MMRNLKMKFLSTRSLGVVEETSFEDVSLEEVIELPKFDLSTINLMK